MDSDFESSFERSPLKVVNTNAKKPAPKKAAIEQIYQKKTQLEHILLRPDSYIGSVERETKPMWVWDEEDGAGKMTFREISYIPGLYKIFDEILVNASDNKQRDKSMNCIKIDIDVDSNEITIYNNGKGIPVVEHKDEKLYVPTMIFGHLLTSSNYDDNEKKVVGGRNGFGAKLCNIFSNRFKVETSYKEYRKAFSQVWTDNMRNAKEVKISSNASEDFTRITFQPDLSKFKMAKLDKDIVALFSRRAFDVAGSSKGVKVYLNGKRLPISGFKDYVELFLKDKEDEVGNPIKVAYEVVNDRWEIAATVSDRGFQQNSFVNSIATTRGGKHVDYVADQIVTKLADIIKKKNKQGVSVKPFQIKNHLWVFVNCLIENPTFDSQTKDTMTLAAKSFGSKCVPDDKFFNTVTKVGVVEAILSWVKFKAQTELSKKCHAKKHSKLTGIPKLEDANDAGTKNSMGCTLILTEGDSAKSLVVAGLGVVGRDKYGIFPLRGKLLNVREASHKQILENAEINNIIKIVGLQYKKKYESTEDLKTLRYGKLMIMTDQDQDGSHIKGLLINFIHHNWPSLLKLDFLEEFITPIVKASKGNDVHSFYSLPEFEEWKKGVPQWRKYKIKYYKGLGTSTSIEAKEYFTKMERHRIRFVYTGAEDDHCVELAFSKKMVDQRKDWLTNSLEERKRRRELGLSEMYLYETNTRNVSYKDFVNKELVLFSNMDNERSIPSLVDGLKPGQRKVIYTCFKRNDKREVKVAQLAGSVGEHSAYHHGEASLMATIINLAHDFVGSNNINLLMPNGQFGTRLQGGKDAASPRYIFTMLNPLARKLFCQLDEPLLNYLYDDNLKIEPEYYVPIIPTILVNGSEGIGTGWSTKIPNYDPREIIENIRRMIRGEEPTTMKPWYKGFRGTIEQIDPQRFIVSGEAAILSPTSFEITELPVKTWTQTYKESVLETFLNGTEKSPSFISDYKEYHTDTTVRFVVSLPEENLKKSLDGLHKTFKIQSSLSTTSMVLFDANGCMKKYETPDEIIKDFYPVRLEYYVKRKTYYEGILEAEALKLDNQARFILEKNDGIIIMENRKRADFIAQLIERGYDSDPVWEWKKKDEAARKNADHEEAEAEEDQEADAAEDDKEEETTGSRNFEYLLEMRMRSMLRERVEELKDQRDKKKAELEKLRKMTPKDIWEEDLVNLLAELDAHEKREREEADGTSAKAIKAAKASKAKAPLRLGKAKDNGVSVEETKPAKGADRVEPKIEVDPKKTERKKREPKAEGAAKDEKKKGPKKVKVEKEDDPKQKKITNMMASSAGAAAALASVTDDNTDDDSIKILEGPKPKLKLKQTANLKQSTINFKPAKRPSDASDSDAPVAGPSGLGTKKVAAAKPKPKPKAKKVAEKRKSSDYSDDDDSVRVVKKPTKKAKKAINSDSDASMSDINDDDGSSNKPKGSSPIAKQRNVRDRKKVNYKPLTILSSESEAESEPESESSQSDATIDEDDLADF